MSHYPQEVVTDAIDALIRGGRTRQEAWREAHRRLGIRPTGRHVRTSGNSMKSGGRYSGGSLI